MQNSTSRPNVQSDQLQEEVKGMTPA